MFKVPLQNLLYVHVDVTHPNRHGELFLVHYVICGVFGGFWPMASIFLSPISNHSNHLSFPSNLNSISSFGHKEVLPGKYSKPFFTLFPAMKFSPLCVNLVSVLVHPLVPRLLITQLTKILLLSHLILCKNLILTTTTLLLVPNLFLSDSLMLKLHTVSFQQAHSGNFVRLSPLKISFTLIVLPLLVAQDPPSSGALSSL